MNNQIKQAEAAGAILFEIIDQKKENYLLSENILPDRSQKHNIIIPKNTKADIKYLLDFNFIK